MTLGPDNSALLLMLALTEQKVLIHSLRYQYANTFYWLNQYLAPPPGTL